MLEEYSKFTDKFTHFQLPKKKKKKNFLQVSFANSRGKLFSCLVLVFVIIISVPYRYIAEIFASCAPEWYLVLRWLDDGVKEPWPLLFLFSFTSVSVTIINTLNRTNNSSAFLLWPLLSHHSQTLISWVIFRGHGDDWCLPLCSRSFPMMPGVLDVIITSPLTGNENGKIHINFSCTRDRGHECNYNFPRHKLVGYCRYLETSCANM